MSAHATSPDQSIVCDRSIHLPSKYMVADAPIEQVSSAWETLYMGIGEYRSMEQQKGTHVEQTYRDGLCSGVSSYLPSCCAVAASGANDRSRAGKGNGNGVNKRKSQWEMWFKKIRTHCPQSLSFVIAAAPSSCIFDVGIYSSDVVNGGGGGGGGDKNGVRMDANKM